MCVCVGGREREREGELIRIIYARNARENCERLYGETGRGKGLDRSRRSRL